MKKQIAGWASSFSEAFYYNQGVGFGLLDWHGAAIASFDKVLHRNPEHVRALLQKAMSLRQLMRHDEALASCEKVIAFKPANPGGYFHRGIIMIDKGNLPEARRMFDKALALKPNFPIALAKLADIRKYRDIDQPEITRMKALLDHPLASSDAKKNLCFSLGKVHDDCGLYDDAFAYYRKANRHCNREAFYRRKATTKYSDSIINTFDKEFLSQPWMPENPLSPIFIVGMPRSGTTLTAQILSNHSAIATAGELSAISISASRLCGLIKKRIAYPEATKHITPEIASRLIEDYEKELRRDAGPDIPFVVDKYPINFQHLGFISLLFPKARIIHCMRHPLDIALSNYFQQFQMGLNYSFSLRNIGHFYNEYAKLMAHWRKVLPIPILNVRYEDTIANTEKAIRKMLDFLGLEWNDRCLSPHTNTAPVGTASNWQVRQPIYDHSVERWRHYEKHLAPLKEMLKDHLRDDSASLSPCS